MDRSRGSLLLFGYETGTTQGPEEVLKMKGKVEKTEDQWRAELDSQTYRVTRCGGTEPPFTGKYYHHKADGVYRCSNCHAPLFDSSTKYDSGSGWPSFFAPIEEGRIEERLDTSHGMVRTEIVCASCEAHLGHVFSDGPRPTGQRYCVNSVSLDFEDR
jgi:peptide-methionine (R)-S-oxide reductase